MPAEIDIIAQDPDDQNVVAPEKIDDVVLGMTAEQHDYRPDDMAQFLFVALCLSLAEGPDAVEVVLG